MPPIVKATSPARLLALVPRMLGFTPRRSIVLVPFSRGRSIGTMRLDLPSASEQDELARIASDITGLVCRLPDADAFALIMYTDEALRADGDAIRHAALADAVAIRAHACGLHMVHLLCVASDGWASYLVPEESRALDELIALPADDALPPAEAGDQTAGAELPRVGALECARVAYALDGIDAAAELLRALPGEAIGSRRIDPLAIAALEALDDLPLFFDRALSWDPERLDAHATAMMAWCLARPAVRDIGLIVWTDGRDGGDRAVDAQIDWEAGAPYPPDIGERMWGNGPRPDPDRLRGALALVRRIAAVTPPEARPGPLATCAWLSWALGRSTHAGIYVDQARELEPGHRLSGIVGAFLQAGHLPDWAFQANRIR